MTADDIANQYPYLAPEAQATALEIFNTVDALMKIVLNKDAFPSDDVRKMLGQQAAGFRTSAVSMIGQK